MLSEYEKIIESKYSSKNTKSAYLFAVKQYLSMYKDVTKYNLENYKLWLIETYKPQTVNLRIRGINSYIEFIGKTELLLKSVKVQNKTFLENVISNADYDFFKTSLYNDKNYDWYFVIRFMAATGARVSELLNFKVEHIKDGYLDIYSKGGKLRRIYIPISLKNDALTWLNQKNLTSGYIFLNKNNAQLTSRGVASQLKNLARKYGIDEKVVYPHSFRHRFAKNFLEKSNDIAFLADLMGHESIETTRIYLRKTSTEQRTLVDNIIDW